ncbi:LCP family protein [Cryptosporangium phraense]|uniref:LCP family protein n=1 Tax=Cryptosporangium phraense TaxID=2593070 RepID=UPI001479603A|nr:LCP family protein [Cryptosporangium phraense]
MAEFESAPADPKPGTQRQRRGLRWWQNLLIGLLALVLIVGGTAFGLVQYYDSQVERQPLIDQPAAPVDWGDGPLDLLLFGADSSSDSPDVDGRKLDTIMVIHLNRALDRATVVSIPRASYVNVPRGGSWPGGKTTLDRAVVLGGPVMVAKTVTQLTQIELDGAMIANLDSVNKLVDAVGGVRICINTDEPLPGGGVRKKGCRNYDGGEAESFMRERKQGQGSDFDRINDQQRVVKALIEKASSAGVLANPLKLNKLLGTTADALTVDEGLDVSKFALSIRHIRPGNVEFATVPVKRADLNTPDGPAVELDPVLAPQLFDSIRNDSVTDWLKNHRSSTTK